MILPHGATVAVTDGTRMLLFRNTGREAIDLEQLPHPAIEPGHAGSGGRHRTSTANPDSHRLEEDDFAAAASAYLNKEVLAGNIGSLAIIANARTLGEMRRHFHLRRLMRRSKTAAAEKSHEEKGDNAWRKLHDAVERPSEGRVGVTLCRARNLFKKRSRMPSRNKYTTGVV